MEILEALKETLEEILKRIEIEYSNIEIIEDEKDTYLINIKSENPNLLIGFRGTNIQAIQHLLKVMAWQKCKNENFSITLDVDDYRKRQEEGMINMAQRKIEMARKFKRPQRLPPMSPYFRRKIHLMCMGSGYEDVETLSDGEGEMRHIIIKPKF
ncbi:MAG: R3H domain-containing nucleic acid-binding protein [Candidatus Gracilibacteria bacterium]|jgi:spoIIIJ-associated protein